MIINDFTTYQPLPKHDIENSRDLCYIKLEVKISLDNHPSVFVSYFYNKGELVFHAFFLDKAYQEYAILRKFLDCDPIHCQLGIEVPVIYINHSGDKSIRIPYAYDCHVHNGDKRHATVYQSLDCPEFMTLDIYTPESSPKAIHSYKADIIHPPDYLTISRLLFGMIETRRTYYEDGFFVHYDTLESL